MQDTLIVADSGQAFSWLISALIVWVRDYGWMVALAGFAVVWLMRRTRHPIMAAAMSCLFTTCSLLLPASFVLNQVTYATSPKNKPKPETEVQKAIVN